MKVSRRHRSFWGEERGAVAVIFALVLIPLLLAAGVAVDYIRNLHARVALQAAVDAAVLAVGSDPQSKPETVRTVIQNYLNVNFPGLIARQADIVFPQGSETITFSATAELPTTFMRVAGIDVMRIDARSEAVMGGSGPLDLVMVLDVTESMNGLVNGQSKISILRNAALHLAGDIMAGEDQANVGIVPYYQYVRVPMSHRTSPWLTIQADQQLPQSCRVVKPAVGCRQVPSTCDGLPCQVTQCDQPAVTECINQTRTWNGCIGNRREAFHKSIASPTNPRYFGFVGWRERQCGPFMTELTNNRQEVLDAINGLFIADNFQLSLTYIPIGLIWGWNMMTSEAPLTRARTKTDMDRLGGQRAMVLMTDGNNTALPNNSTSWGVEAINISTYRTRGSDPNDPASYADDLTRDLCQSIKNDGITLYTVLFDVTEGKTKKLLEDCATDKKKAFNTSTSAGLVEAFREIGASLKEVRLSK
jgi:Flp pilus assembly protein TadG